MSSKQVAVLMGGWGEEREISVKTGEAVAAALESRGHQVTRVLAGPGLDQTLRATRAEVAFVALHGRMGEDGKVQGLLEVLGLPYTGSGVMASALAMNKPFAKRLFRHHNLETPCGYCVRREEVHAVESMHGDLGFPCVVKPAQGGSSVGLSVVRGEGELGPAAALACRYGGEALVERRIEGKEITVGILGDQVLGTCEITHGADAFDFRSKYAGGSRYHLPARLSPARLANVEQVALKAYRALGCRGYGRVDLLASSAGNDVLLEVNTLPGMTGHSLLPKIARKAGLSFEDLAERILLSARVDDSSVSEAPPVAAPAARRRAAS